MSSQSMHQSRITMLKESKVAFRSKKALEVSTYQLQVLYYKVT